jgi:hypothetical protein
MKESIELDKFEENLWTRKAQTAARDFLNDIS